MLAVMPAGTAARLITRRLRPVDDVRAAGFVDSSRLVTEPLRPAGKPNIGGSSNTTASPSHRVCHRDVAFEAQRFPHSAVAIRQVAVVVVAGAGQQRAANGNRSGAPAVFFRAAFPVVGTTTCWPVGGPADCTHAESCGGAAPVSAK
jgi:hypothetical protein